MLSKPESTVLKTFPYILGFWNCEVGLVKNSSSFKFPYGRAINYNPKQLNLKFSFMKF